ncbi:MAG TPA: hypothetical protein VGN30_12385, partial [Steroidobacteraceae bacterium]
NRTEAVAIYRKHLPNVPEDAAERHVDALLGEREGLTRGGALDPEGVMTVLRIRSELGRPQRTLTDASRYVDECYHRAADRPLPAALVGASADAADSGAFYVTNLINTDS